MTFIRNELEHYASTHIQAPEHVVQAALKRTPPGQLFTVLGTLDLMERGFVFKRGQLVKWPDWYDPKNRT